MTQVYDRIYISNGDDACNPELLQQNGITGILCVALEYRTRHVEAAIPQLVGWENIRYCGLHDEFPEHTRNTDQQLWRAVQTFTDLYNEGRATLSHCKAGHNRSVAVVVGYLVQSGKFRTVDEAYSHIAAQRECRLQPLLKEHLRELFEKPGVVL